MFAIYNFINICVFFISWYMMMSKHCKYKPPASVECYFFCFKWIFHSVVKFSPLHIWNSLSTKFCLCIHTKNYFSLLCFPHVFSFLFSYFLKTAFTLSMFFFSNNDSVNDMQTWKQSMIKNMDWRIKSSKWKEQVKMMLRNTK